MSGFIGNIKIIAVSGVCTLLTAAIVWGVIQMIWTVDMARL